MTLTTEDIQLIKESLKPEFDGLRKEMNQQFDYIDQRFNKIEHRLDRMEQKLDGIEIVVDELVESVTVEGNQRYSDHERRIKALETEIHNRS